MKKLLIITGLSFAGKTTLGNAIARRFGYEQVDVDVTKVLLYGSHVKDEELSRSDWDRIYAETDHDICRQGKPSLTLPEISPKWRGNT